MKNKSQEDEFYNELDEKTGRQSCSCQTLAIFFSIILILTVGLTFYLFRQIKKVNFSFAIVSSTLEDKNKFLEKMKLNPQENQTFALKITSEELTSLVTEGLSIRNFLIKDLQMLIDKEGIKIFGMLIKPLSSKIKIETAPVVEDGKIKLTIKKVQAGSLILPKYFFLDLENSLNAMTGQIFEGLYQNYQVEKIELEINQMTIFGKLKEVK